MPNKHPIFVQKLCLSSFLIIHPIACLSHIFRSVIVRPDVIDFSLLKFSCILISIMVIDFDLSPQLIILKMALADSALFVTIRALTVHLLFLQLAIVIVFVFEEYFCLSFDLVILPQSLQGQLILRVINIAYPVSHSLFEDSLKSRAISIVNGPVSLLLIIFEHPFVHLLFLSNEKLSISLFLVVKPITLVNFTVFVVIAPIS